ncbi:protein kinase domain-containing protein [Rubripirellula reticaptiva]|uniref:protein kinase domain-containing protein n=1 Tax=Rubripirellula reticaptiva TaxID=2528013 RepID=UPI00164461D2|nr:protein kinase [Rubripirellula reticaptiva]
MTSLVSDSIVQRLRNSGQFSSVQLSLVQEELDRYFVSVAEDEWSFIELPAGTQIGDYEIASLIGEGGSGQVYRAKHRSLSNHTVALKLIKNVQSTNRFRREMELVQRLAHPNVVVSYEVGDHRGVLYIAMEEMSGPDLHKRVSISGPINWQSTIQIMIDAAHGLEHAHQRGLIHRDVKPGNLIMDGRRTKVTDLGLAVLTEDIGKPSAQAFHTRCEMAAGTPEFMAPEQALSLASATPLSDIYALGATWFFLLTGMSRIGGATLGEKISNLVKNEHVNQLSELIAPESVRCVLNRMVAHHAEDRFSSMADVATALEAIRTGKSADSPKHGIEILIVEDNQDDLFLTLEMLKRGNNSVTVHEARTLAEAVEVKHQHPAIDLVLLDLQLPDSSGIDTVRQARSEMSNVPLVVLTGQDDIIVGKACIEAGADEFACKNDLTSHLLERIIFITLSRCSHQGNTIADRHGAS